MQYDWDERKCPKKGTPEWHSEVQKKLGDGAQTNGKDGKGAAGKGKKANNKDAPAATAAKNTSKAADATASKGPAAKRQKSGEEATPSTLQRVSAPFKHLAEVVNDTADKLKEVPQVLGQKISDAMPSSSKKQSSGKPAVSTGTNSTAQPLTDAAQKAQQAIAAMSPARGSGTGKRAASSKKQDAPPAKRASRHAATAAAPTAVVQEDNDVEVDIEGDADKVWFFPACLSCWHVLCIVLESHHQGILCTMPLVNDLVW